MAVEIETISLPRTLDELAQLLERSRQEGIEEGRLQGVRATTRTLKNDMFNPLSTARVYLELGESNPTILGDRLGTVIDSLCRACTALGKLHKAAVDRRLEFFQNGDEEMVRPRSEYNNHQAA